MVSRRFGVVFGRFGVVWGVLGWFGVFPEGDKYHKITRMSRILMTMNAQYATRRLWILTKPSAAVNVNSGNMQHASK